MGILSIIKERKEQFQNATVQRRKQVLMRRTEKIQSDNLRQAELTEARQKLAEAQQINQDLRGASPVQPSGLKKFGVGLKNVIDKQKAKKKGKSIAEKVAGSSKGKKVAMPVSSGSQGSTSQGGIFGGQRPIDVGGSGGGSPFNQGGKGFQL